MQDLEYWKKRCELAEKCLVGAHYFATSEKQLQNDKDYKKFISDYDKNESSKKRIIDMIFSKDAK